MGIDKEIEEANLKLNEVILKNLKNDRNLLLAKVNEQVFDDNGKSVGISNWEIMRLLHRLYDEVIKLKER